MRASTDTSSVILKPFSQTDNVCFIRHSRAVPAVLFLRHAGMIQHHLRLLQKVVCVSINRGSSLAVRSVHSTSAMSNSKYEYVRGYEADDRLLPNTWIVVRVDGKQFHV